MTVPQIAAVEIATEPAVSPVAAAADAPPDVLSLPAGDECWSILHTLSRREKKVARACEGAVIRHYLPLHASRSRGAGQPTASLPLFPGYIFACLTPEARTARLTWLCVREEKRHVYPATLRVRAGYLPGGRHDGARILSGLRWLWLAAYAISLRPLAVACELSMPHTSR